MTFTLSAGALADDTASKAGSAAGSTGEWGGLYNGRTLGSGGGAVFAEGGWPDVGAGVLFGVGSGVDLGARIGGTYSPDNFEVNRVFVSEFGLDLRAVGRFKLVETDSVSLILRAEPGFRFASFDVAVTGGPIIDVAADVGIRVMQGGSIYLGLEVPTTIFVVNIANAFIQIPVLAGAGFEYHVNDFIALGGRFNAGPSIDVDTGPAGTTAYFAFIAQGFFMFRWDRVK